MNVKTWLPVFPGFYCTIFEPDEENEIDYVQSERENNKCIGEIKWNHYKFDYQQYENDVAESCCSIIEWELPPDLITSIKCEKVVSPKEYNFRNDSIYIEIELSEENVKNLKKYIFNHIDEFKGYIKQNYTSYDGFMSWYSNDATEWLNEIDQAIEDDHKLGALLNFICEVENITQETLYYDMEAYLSLINYDDCTTLHICKDCGEFIPKDHKCYSDIEKYKKNTGVLPTSVRCDDCIVEP